MIAAVIVIRAVTIMRGKSDRDGLIKMNWWAVDVVAFAVWLIFAIGVAIRAVAMMPRNSVNQDLQ